jgi:transposase
VVKEPFREARDLLETIPDISTRAAGVNIAETDADMTRFPSAGHLASWAGVCPGSNESTGRVKSSRTRPGNPYPKGFRGVAELSAIRSNDTFYSAQYSRLAKRRGHNKATVAVAHSILDAAWHLLTNGTLYTDPGAGFFESRHDPRVEAKRLQRKIEVLGFEVNNTPTAA